MRRLTNYLIKCNQESTEKLLFIVGIFIFVWIGIIAVGSLAINHFTDIPTRGCIINRLTGLYCPGCGGTRAVISIFEGNLAKSLYYNAFAAYTAILYILFMSSWGLSYMTKGKIKGLKFRPWMIYAGIVLLVFQWILKNVLLIFWKIYII